MLGIRKKANANQAGELSLINSLGANSVAKISPDLLDKILKCMNSLMNIAANNSFRNVIIDQVYKQLNMLFYENIIEFWSSQTNPELKYRKINLKIKTVKLF